MSAEDSDQLPIWGQITQIWLSKIAHGKCLLKMFDMFWSSTMELGLIFDLGMNLNG